MASNIRKYYGVAKKKRIANMAISVLALIAIMVVLITIYGQNVGNFVIAIEGQSQLNLALSETEDFADPKSRLSAGGIKDITHATYINIPDDIENGDGLKNDIKSKRYFAYSFYLKNLSGSLVDYETEIVIRETTKGADSALRVLVIRDGGRSIYAKPKEAPEPADQIGQPADQGTQIEKDYTTIPFASAITIMQERVAGIVMNAVHKYTIVMWIEGWDPQCTDDIIGATLRMEMVFRAKEPTIK